MKIQKCLVDTKYNIRFWLDVTDRKEDENQKCFKLRWWVDDGDIPKVEDIDQADGCGEKMNSFWSIDV